MPYVSRLSHRLTIPVGPDANGSSFSSLIPPVLLLLFVGVLGEVGACRVDTSSDDDDDDDADDADDEETTERENVSVIKANNTIHTSCVRDDNNNSSFIASAFKQSKRNETKYRLRNQTKIFDCH